MKRLLLGLTLLAIIFIAVLCKPIDNNNEEVLLESSSINAITNGDIR